MAYNIKNIQEQFAVMNGEKKPKFDKKGPPFLQWKPTLTEDNKSRTFNVRLLPYQDQNDQPFQTVNYYDSKKVSPFRLVAPAQFNLPDPMAELVTELRKQRNNKEAWNVIKELLPKPRYFAPVLVREEAEKGVQIWELSPTVCKDIYAVLVSDDYRDEDVTNTEKGYDLQVMVSPSGKVFKAPNGKEYPVNDIKVNARTKPSKLAKTPEEAEKLVASIPNLLEIFTKQVKDPKDLKEMLETFLSAGEPANEESGTNHTADTDVATEAVSSQSVEDQFAGL